MPTIVVVGAFFAFRTAVLLALLIGRYR